MAEEKRQGSWLVICFFAILALTLGFWLQTHAEKKRFFQSPYSSTLSVSIPLKAFHLMDDEGKSFTNNNLMGHWSLLFFGYSSCPDLCPTTLTKLNKAYQILQASNTHMAPQVIFITIDPKRDTPKELQQYLNKFNKNFIGVTGSEKEITNLTKSIGIAYLKIAKSKKNYDFQHSGIIIVINPNGEWVAIMHIPPTGREIAKDFQRIQNTL